MFLEKKLNIDIICQSFISLMINFMGLFACGDIFAEVSRNTLLEKYPMVFTFTCVMSFTGIVETLFTIYITKYKETMYNDYYNIVKTNSAMLLMVSVVFGATIGSSGLLISFLYKTIEIFSSVKFILAITISCFIGTFLFILSLVITLEIAEIAEIDAKNIVIPLISAVSDVIHLLCMRNIVLIVDSVTENVAFILYLFSALVFGVIFLYYLSQTKYINQESSDTIGNVSNIDMVQIDLHDSCDDEVQGQQLNSVAFITMNISSFLCCIICSFLCGVIVEKVSVKMPLVPQIFPFFSGMSLSIALIYWHKNYNTVMSKGEKQIVVNTLLSITLVISLIYLLILYMYEYSVNSIFSLIFIGFFSALTLGLMFLLEKFNGFEVRNMELFTLPTITIISDIVSIFMLLIIGYVNK
ncbi:ribosomal protein [Ecytonucleospora hepatopenaei]|uniref:Ribosomal protein n=1 Tax=Ecytonucleospora hepatopenaei TaxID=646526 RepID=A0A1W0E6H7_9MICR|nr:ribosomal protein [Ecytonucleospora hepatopenaei]